MGRNIEVKKSKEENKRRPYLRWKHDDKRLTDKTWDNTLPSSANLATVFANSCRKNKNFRRVHSAKNFRISGRHTIFTILTWTNAKNHARLWTCRPFLQATHFWARPSWPPTTNNNNNIAFFSQASWGRLVMKPERNKFKDQAHW